MSIYKLISYIIVSLCAYGIVQTIYKVPEKSFSMEPLYTFSSSPNQMETFGFFKKGFVLSDAVTTCTFLSVFPISGNVSLHGGKLYLAADLIFQNVASLGTCGEIHANHHAIDLCSSITGLPGPYPALFYDATLFLNGDLVVSTTTKFMGNCTIDGRWNNLSLGNGGSLIIGHNSSLRLRNLELNGIMGNNLLCMDDSAQLILDNVRWFQGNDYTFTRGSIQMDNNVNFGRSHSFIYASSLTSTVNANATWHLSDGATLVMGRKNGIDDREPLYLTDDTSMLKIEQCTLSVTSSGMCLTRGRVLMDREVVVSIDGQSEATGLIFGDGTPENDLQVFLYPNAVLKLVRGWLVNNMTHANNFSTADVPIKYVQVGNSIIVVKQNINYSNVTMAQVGSGGAVVDSGKQIFYNNVSIQTPAVDFTVTATRHDQDTMLFAGGGKITVTRGTYPFATLVHGADNVFNGIGIVTGPIFIADFTASMTLALLGTMNTDITLYGGLLTLQADLSFGQDYCIAGAGSVDLASQNMSLNLLNRLWISALSFHGNGGTIEIKSNLELGAPLTFSGYVHINGYGNVLELIREGSLTVLPNSTLHLKNVLIDNIGGRTICCQDDSAKLVLEDVTWIQNDDVIFKQGTIDFFGDVEMLGPHTFALQTKFTSTIHDHTTLTFDTSFTLSYDAVNTLDTMLAFEDPKYSVVCLRGACLHVTRYGMPLRGGKMIVEGSSHCYAEIMFDKQGFVSPISAITLGDGTQGDDFSIHVTQGASLIMDSGYLVYNNVDMLSLTMNNNLSTIAIGPSSVLRLERSLSLRDGRLQFKPGSLLVRAEGVSIDGTVEYVQ